MLQIKTSFAPISVHSAELKINFSTLQTSQHYLESASELFESFEVDVPQLCKAAELQKYFLIVVMEKMRASK